MRNNKLVYSAPKNTYLQILSEIGIFGFLKFLFVCKIFNYNFKIILKKN